MRQKEFTKEQVKRTVKRVRKTWKKGKFNGTNVSLRSVLGDYINNSMLRHIKEVMFTNDGFSARSRAKWRLIYPNKRAGKIAKEVMERTYVTKGWPF